MGRLSRSRRREWLAGTVVVLLVVAAIWGLPLFLKRDRESYRLVATWGTARELRRRVILDVHVRRTTLRRPSASAPAAD